MATRVDRTPGLDRLAESTLLRKLRLESPRRETDANFVGLKRSNALSDIDNPPKALDNILDKLSQTDVEERNRRELACPDPVIPVPGPPTQ